MGRTRLATVAERNATGTTLGARHEEPNGAQSDAGGVPQEEPEHLEDAQVTEDRMVVEETPDGTSGYGLHKRGHFSPEEIQDDIKIDF